MTRIVIGSTAAVEHGLNWRKPKDVDVFSDAPAPREDAFWDERLRDWFGDDERVATLDELLTIKQSHSYWNLQGWDKHMSDLLRLQDAGAQLIPELHDLLRNVWEDKHGKKVVNLDQEAEDFFGDAVPRLYDHDSLHRSVAYTPGKPLYENFLSGEVLMDMKQVWAAPMETQLALFREEIYATALERLVIPADYRYSPGAAYSWALKRVITSLTKGKSAKFLVDNYRALRRPDMDYVAHHRNNAHFLEPFDTTVQ